MTDIEPDTKDWTWVLDRPCPECGFDASTFDHDDVAVMLRENAVSWADVLTAQETARRPQPNVWSPLEYACHVRDVCRVYAERLHLMLTEDDPHYPDWDQDATAIEDRYSAQDPHEVATELVEAAENLAAYFERVSSDAWHRPGERSDGAHFTVDSFARYFIHDPVHHLHDVTGSRVKPSE